MGAPVCSYTALVQVPGQNGKRLCPNGASWEHQGGLKLNQEHWGAANRSLWRNGKSLASRTEFSDSASTLSPKLEKASGNESRRQKWAIRLIRFVAVAARTFHSCREGFTDPPPTAGESGPCADEIQEPFELGRGPWLSTETPRKQALLWGRTSTSGSYFQGKFPNLKRPFLFKSITLVNKSNAWAI